MASNVCHVVMFVFVLTVSGSAGLRVVQNPQPYTEMTDELNVTCIPDGPADWAKTIVSLQIVKPGQDTPIASISYAEGLNSRSGSDDNLKAAGIIVKDASQSYLTLMIAKPTRHDSGIYRCKVFYLNENTQMMNENVSGNVTFHDQDLADLEKQVHSLTNTVEDQGDSALKQREAIHRFEKLHLTFNRVHSAQQQDIDTLTEKLSRENDTIQRQNRHAIELEANLSKHTQDIGLLTDKANKQQETIIKLEDNQSKQEQDIDSLTDKTNKQKETIRKLGDNVSKQKQEIDQLTEKTNVQKETIMKLEKYHSKQKQDIDILTDETNKQKETIKKLEDNLSKRKQDIDLLTNKTSKQEDIIVRLEDNQSKQKQDINSLIYKTKKQNDTFVVLEIELSQQKQDIDSLTEKTNKQNDTIIELGKEQKNFEAIDKWVNRNQNERIIRLEKQLSLLEKWMKKKVCIDGWTYYKPDETCIRLFGQDWVSRHSWYGARELCQGLGGDLVQIKDEDKNSFVLDMIYDVHNWPWIGIRNNVTDGFDFQYVDNTPLGGQETFQSWAPGFPLDRHDGKYTCVDMHTKSGYPGKWGNGDCNIKGLYLCSTPSNGTNIV